MNNIYYYTYFLFIKFSEKVKKDLPDSAFTGLALISTILLFNVFTLVFYVGGSVFTKGNATSLGCIIAFIVLLINYFILYKKSKDIVAYYTRKYQNRKHNIIGILLIIIYVIASFLICARLAYLVRNHLL